MRLRGTKNSKGKDDEVVHEIEPLGVEHLPDCLALAKDRGWAQRVQMWRLLLAEGHGFGVRDKDGRLAGTVILTWCGDGIAAIGMMLVATRYGRRGIGRRLMECVLAETGNATVFLHATGYGLPLYEKLGFVPVGTSHTHQGVFALTDEVSEDAAGSERMPIGLRPAGLDDQVRILDLDADVFGADRGALLARLPDFGEQLLVADPDGRSNPSAAVEKHHRTDRQLAGFASSWDGTSVTVIGPVIAATGEHAKQLIGELASTTVAEVRIDLDERHCELRSWADEHGLVPKASTTIMVRGARSVPRDRSRCIAPFAPALG